MRALFSDVNLRTVSGHLSRCIVVRRQRRSRISRGVEPAQAGEQFEDTIVEEHAEDSDMRRVDEARLGAMRHTRRPIKDRGTFGR